MQTALFAWFYSIHTLIFNYTNIQNYNFSAFFYSLDVYSLFQKKNSTNKKNLWKKENFRWFVEGETVAWQYPLTV